ncbi:sugar phosphate isomerase/epimerase family protein [Paracoccus shanxieyensis]|uniref:TIM barrel protein n=1 Tax=Paracoccus shanxieyensis TaxID=2675752 RepID=A0A6L6J0X7_9RHOB|nr:sugar phosphate isomerase/epimerase [Paracoccus shanxieyensis]MTH64327.1 TIM barrel protein [Paracoccus shanxieyensis]MTH87680.1 TIM barrel protein [Paracoccus shanxieyensis]
MNRAISLAHLTVVETAPPQMIRMAARLGYDAVGLRLLRVTPETPGYPLMDDPQMMAQTRAALAETGLRVQDIEFVRITPEFDLNALRPFLRAGAELGAAHVICAPYDPDLSRLADNLALMAQECRAHGMQAVLEFFPWTSVPDLATALRVVEPVADLGILVDTLHFNRSGSSLEDLRRALPRMPFLHLCDAPVHPPYTTEQFFHAGRVERLPPGAGQIPLAPIMAELPPDLPVTLEIPMTAKALAEGEEAVAAHVIAATRQFLTQL